MLSDEHRMTPPRRLSALFGRERRCQPAGDEIPRVVQDDRHAFGVQILAIARVKRETPPKGRLLRALPY